MLFRRVATTSATLMLLLSIGCSEREHAAHESHAGSESHAEATESHANATDAAAEEAALQRADPRGTYGAGIVLEESVALQAILDAPESYESRIVQVNAKVEAVCPKRGCWIDVADSEGASMRVKVTDGDIVFPLSAQGHDVVVEGIVERIELDEQQHRAWKEHEAEELGIAFDAASVRGPTTMWRLQGLGARIDE